MNTFFLPTAAPRTAPLCFTVFRTCRKPCRTGVWPGGDRLAPTIVRVPYRTGTKEQSTQRKKRTKAEITASPCVRDGGECDFVKLPATASRVLVARALIDPHRAKTED